MPNISWTSYATGALDNAQTLLELGALVGARDRGGGTPLFRTCFHGHAPVAAALLAAGADVLQVLGQSAVMCVPASRTASWASLIGIGNFWQMSDPALRFGGVYLRQRAGTSPQSVTGLQMPAGQLVF